MVTDYKHIKEIDKLIPLAKKAANLAEPEGAKRGAMPGAADAWTRAYFREMNRLAIAKGLRVP